MPRSAPSRRLRHRATAALRHPATAAVATLLWLLGIELLPGLHVALHDHLAHHHHGAADYDHCEHRPGVPDPNEHLSEADEDHGHHHGSHGHHHGSHEHHTDHAAESHHEPHAHSHHGDHARPASAKPHVDHHADHHADHRADHHADRSLASSSTTEDVRQPIRGPAFEARTHGPHGDGSIAHRDVVPLTPPAALPPVVWTPGPITLAVTPLRVRTQSRTPTTLRARGPPRSLDSVVSVPA